MMLIGDEPQSYPSYRDIAHARLKMGPMLEDHVTARQVFIRKETFRGSRDE